MRTKPTLTYSKLDEETGSRWDSMFGKTDSMIEVNPGKVVLPAPFTNIGEDILHMEVKDTDVWLCSLPRTGSTWCQEIIWLIGHNLDYEGAKSLQLIRCPKIELSCMSTGRYHKWHEESINDYFVDLVKYRLSDPRYVRSHLPWNLLPVDILNDDNTMKPKIIYITRNPKDMAISYYHYCILMHGLKGTLEEFCDLLMKGRAPFGPVWDHILEFWNRRHDPNVLFIKFEEMKCDLPSVVGRVAEFLNKKLTDLDVDNLCEYLSFQNMKSNRAVNLDPIFEKAIDPSYLEQSELRFIRKGELGDWKNHMSNELSRRFDEWTEQHLRGTGLSYD